MPHLITTDGSSIITLSGSEVSYKFPVTTRVFQIQNIGSSTVYASIYPDITDHFQGITAILPGHSAIIDNNYIKENRTIYLLGDGKVQIIATDIVTSLFNK